MERIRLQRLERQLRRHGEIPVLTFTNTFLLFLTLFTAKITIFVLYVTNLKFESVTIQFLSYSNPRTPNVDLLREIPRSDFTGYMFNSVIFIIYFPV